MLHLANLSIRRPRAAIAIWAAVAAVLVLLGLGVSRSLSPSIVVPGLSLLGPLCAFFSRTESPDCEMSSSLAASR